MKKFLSVLMVLILLLSACSNERIPEESFSEPENEELFEVSISPVSGFGDARLEIISEEYHPIIVSAEEVAMSEENLEIYEKYITPINNPMPLMSEFSAECAPDIIYTYIYIMTKELDRDVLDIQSDYKSEFVNGDNEWLDGRTIEESFARWFPWNPENYRKYFEYDEETDRYLAPSCGGGPSFSYLTGYEETDDGRILLSYSFYNDDMSGEQDFFKVYFSGILEIKPEEKGWKYLSNTKTFNCGHGTWHNEDYSFDVTTAEWRPREEAVYEICSEPILGKLTVPGILGHSANTESKFCLFHSYNGIWVLNGNKFEVDLISKLPSNENRNHIVLESHFDEDGKAVIVYTPYVEITETSTVENIKEQCGTIKLAVFSLSDRETITFIDTKILPNVFEGGDNVIYIVSEIDNFEPYLK